MENLEQLRLQWQQLKLENLALSEQNRCLTNRLAKQNIRTHQQKLANNYRSLGTLGFIFPLLAWMLYEVVHCSIGMAIAYSIYGIALGAVQHWFSHFVREADYISLPTVEAIAHARKVVRYQRNMTVASIICMVAVIVPLFYELSFMDQSVIEGGIVGGIIGGAIGLMRCIKNFRHANAMLNEASSIDAG